MAEPKHITLADLPGAAEFHDHVSRLPRHVAYEPDVHVNLTMALAMCAGFHDTDSATIAEWNQKVDDLPEMTPMPLGVYNELMGDGVRRRLLWHFTTSDRRAELRRKYEQTISLEDLGKFMHVWQDQYSHADVGPVFGHLFTKVDPKTGNARRPTLSEIMRIMQPLKTLTTGDLQRLYDDYKIFFEKTWHEADNPSKSPEKAGRMARSSYDIFVEACNLFRHKGKLKISHPKTPWTAIKGAVRGFCREANYNRRTDVAADIASIARRHWERQR